MTICSKGVLSGFDELDGGADGRRRAGVDVLDGDLLEHQLIGANGDRSGLSHHAGHHDGASLAHQGTRLSQGA